MHGIVHGKQEEQTLKLNAATVFTAVCASKMRYSEIIPTYTDPISFIITFPGEV